jgi:NAD(P)-dependent dehydrogenase (short-subunit alcohol dehydrogenase family)
MTGPEPPAAAGGPRSVLITGASSGIGRACVEAFDRLGWRVFAGARQDRDLERLATSGSGRVTPLRLDITDADQVAAAARAASDALGDRGLDALVNNAGIVVAGPLELCPPDDFRRELEVNVTGHLVVTQAFISLLRRARGRIVFMSSASGRVALPLIGPYAASKAAVEAMADALRVELKPSGLSVSVIEPGPVATTMLERSIHAAEGRFDDMGPEATARYRPMLEAARAVALNTRRLELPTSAVTRAVIHAATSRRPRSRYLVLRGGWLFRLARALVPDRISDAIILRVLSHYASRERDASHAQVGSP